MSLILKPFKYFFITAYKPWEKRFEALEEIMHMEKIMDDQSDNWDKNNEKIPNWFYQMLIAMGISVSLGFILILFGSI